MRKFFCDICESELTNRDFGRQAGSYTRYKTPILNFEITTGKDGVWNGGDFCRYCIIDAVNTLDDRPKASP